jgi:hypothetical protein
MKAQTVVLCGYAVLAAVCVLVMSTALLRGGHPPGSGIVNLFVLILTYPISLYGLVVGWTARPDAIASKAKSVYVMTGVCLSFAVLVTLVLALKFVFGKSI